MGRLLSTGAAGLSLALMLSMGCSGDPDSTGPRGSGGDGGGGTGGQISPDCGDRTRDATEACDDGNQTDGDGCSADCMMIEGGYRCPTVGVLCVAIVCGDSRIDSPETCDDGNATGGDGCSATCERLDGWSCPLPGVACAATECGDGIVAGFEQCDDGDAVPGDGCSDSATTVPGRTPAPTGIACQTAPGSGRTAAMAVSTRVSRNATTATISAVRGAATPTARRARPAGMEFGSQSSAKAAMRVRTMESPAPDAARPARSSSSSAGAPTGWVAGSRSDLGHLLRVAKTLFGFVPLGLGRVT